MRGPFPLILTSGALSLSKAVLVMICALVQPAHAQTGGLHYVTDKLVLVIRAQPDESSEKIGSVVTGDAVVVMGSNDQGYAQVRLDNGTEGWVQLQYLLADPPAARRLVEAEDELAIMRIEKQQLAGVAEALKLDKADLSNSLDDANDTAETLRQRIDALTEQLRTAASQKTPDNTEELTRLEEEVRLLHIRNRDLRQSYEYHWFAAGGLLALLAAALGLLVGRGMASRRRNW